MTLPTVNLLHLENLSIYKQLQIEEALLRLDKGNWCIFNRGSPLSIVMGISGKPEQLLALDQVTAHSVPVIKRFSGGGTVVVDEATLFVTFIMNQEDTEVACTPDRVHCFSESLYKDVFIEHPFQLKENDYVFHEKKFGGNAQYLRKERWLHHTSFLWDFQEEHMEYLKIPSRAPKYRGGRSHSDFLCKLKDKLVSSDELFNGVKEKLGKKFIAQDVSVESVLSKLEVPHRRATCLVDITGIV